MIVNKSTFADMCGVNKSTLTNNKSLIQLNEQGLVDTEHPKNKAYFQKHQDKANEAFSGRMEKLDGLDIPMEGAVNLDGEQLDQLDKIAVEVRLKLAQAKRHELKYEQDKGNLLTVEAVQQAAAKVGAEIKIRLQSMPRRITPRLVAMAKSGSEDQEIREMLEREIDDAIECIRKTLEASDGR